MKRQKLWLVISTLVLAISSSLVPAQPVGDITPGTQVHATATTEGAGIEFTLYAPPTYDNNGTKRWPLIIQLPPGGALKPGAFSQLTTCGIPQELVTPANCKYVSDRFIVVSPWLPNSGYPAYFTSIHNWIKYLYKTYKIDTTCVSFYGTCWGGNAAYSYFTIHPEIPSAAYLFSINDGWSWNGGGLDLTKACTVKNIELRIVRGTNDCCTPLLACKAAADAIHACGGGNDTFMQIPGGPHESYNFMDTISGMYDWFLLQKKTTPTSTVNPQKNSYGDSPDNLLPAQLLDTRLSVNDRMEVLDVTGRLVFRCNGNDATVGQMMPRLTRGIFLVRVSGGQSFAKIFLTK